MSFDASIYRPLVPVPLLPDEEPSSNLGTPPKFLWLPPARLLVDMRYQREIGDRGRKNIRNIVENFDWGRFTPVVVAPIDGWYYAIIDGQHRSTGVLTHGGIPEVPCIEVDADCAMQARAFIHINGSVTKVTPMQIYHAGISARDPDALKIDQVVTAAGITILKYPKQQNDRKPGETMCAALIGRLIGLHGARAVRLALTGLKKADFGGLITAPVIRGAVEVAVSNPSLSREEGPFIDALGSIRHDSLIMQAEAERLVDRRPQTLIYRDLLKAEMVRRIAPAKVAAVVEAHTPAELALISGLAALVDLSTEELTAETRKPLISHKRFQAFYLLHTAIGRSLSSIGVLFRMDRTSIAHAVKSVERWREDDKFDARIEGLATRARCLVSEEAAA
ncbi:helix-turn-helix domain-containing protein [Parvibaculum sp.]|uniref:helix-turn-helix domain-containing protein n=1 Tax=Parvibaculum sp. TaxID=2024848 RepID=UPI0027356CE5|nr:helix-turn-helix domain-containing protein [Parvibaculum sp.]MDP3328736.1 helix-turn-helix domain-containing protein [Parvibaculum sp.]